MLLTFLTLSLTKYTKQKPFAHKTGQSTKVKFPSGLETHIIQSQASWDSAWRLGQPGGFEGPAELHWPASHLETRQTGSGLMMSQGNMKQHGYLIRWNVDFLLKLPQEEACREIVTFDHPGSNSQRVSIDCGQHRRSSQVSMVLISNTHTEIGTSSFAQLLNATTVPRPTPIKKKESLSKQTSSKFAL